MNRERYRKLLDYMRSHREDMMRDLCFLAAMPSVLSESSDKNEPFGSECARCLEKAAGLFSSYGFETKLMRESGYALSFYGTGKKTTGLFAHTDVVSVNEADWVLSKPFEPSERDGFLIGRGVSDNKAGVIASLYVMRALRDLGLACNSRIMTFLGSNEESGMQDIANFVRENPMPDLSFVPDTGFPLALGQRGILRFTVSSRRAFSDMIALSGGNAFNTVLALAEAKIKYSDELAAELQDLPETISVDVGETLITVTAQGLAAHASCPECGKNALLLLSRYLLTCSALPERDRAILADIADMLESCYAENWDAAYDTPAGKLTAANGIVRTSDGRPELTFDVRFGPLCEEEMLGKIQTYFAEKDFVYLENDFTHCKISDAGKQEIQTFMDGYAAITGDAQAVPYVMGGGTYAYYLDNAYAVGYYTDRTPSTFTLPPGHGGAHQADEILPIDGLVEGAAILGELLIEVSEGEKR